MSEFSLIRIATPELLGMGPECQMDFPVHSFFHFLLASCVECITFNYQLYTQSCLATREATCIPSLLYRKSSPPLLVANQIYTETKMWCVARLVPFTQF